MSDGVIRLTVPGELIYRDVAIRAVAAACRLARSGEGTDTGAPLDLSDEFDAELVSAVSEIFNNIVIHGYDPRRNGGMLPVDFEIRLTGVAVEVLITDHGTAFDIESVPPPELERLPEGGMGIHIARSCVDDLDYTPGPPNRWHMTKLTTSAPVLGRRPGRRRASTQQ